MNKIIPRERVKAALNFEETDMVPYDQPGDILIQLLKYAFGVNRKAGENK